MKSTRQRVYSDVSQSLCLYKSVLLHIFLIQYLHNSCSVIILQIFLQRKRGESKVHYFNSIDFGADNHLLQDKVAKLSLKLKLSYGDGLWYMADYHAGCYSTI